MSFLRRMFGGGGGAGGSAGGGGAVDDGAADREDAEHDRELLAAEAERTSGDLIARQLRYADRAWTPPAQGGSRRADDPGAGDS